MKLRNLTLILCVAISLIGCGQDAKKPTKKSEPAKKEIKKPLDSEEQIANETEKESIKEEKQAEQDAIAEEQEVNKEEEKIDPKQLEKAKEIIKSVSKKDIAAVDTKKKFRMLCASCHGFKGNMMINGAKDLTKSEISLAESVRQVYFGKGLMTPFKGVMTDAEIVAVCQYIEELRK